MLGKTILLNKTISVLVASSFIAILVMAMPGCGGSSSSGGGGNPVISLLAGDILSPNRDLLDGSLATASFADPYGVATDSAGNLYVAEKDSCDIRKITRAGDVSTLAGYAGACSSIDGTGANAGFNNPVDAATDSAGNVYVTDMYSVRKITPAGVVTTLATGFNRPHGVAVDSTGNVYVADKFNNAIKMIDTSGVVTTLATGFNRPHGVAVDSTGNVYVADTRNGKISMIGTSGVVTVTTLATGFNRPEGVAVDSAGNVYVADTNNHVISTFNVATVAVSGVTALAGSGASGYADGVGTAAIFSGPQGIAIDSTGSTLYVADSWNNRHSNSTNSAIRKVVIATGVVTTLSGRPHYGNADGTGAAATFGKTRGTKGLTTDSAGNVYVADRRNGSVRKITPAGKVSTLATGFNQPRSVAVDSAGNVYVLDYSGNVNQITPATVAASGVVSTVASGFSGNPGSLTFDSAGNLYVADGQNCVIKKITDAMVPASAVVSTVAGTGNCGTSDGNATTTATFKNPQGIAMDGAGNLYVAEGGNSGSNTIRKITPATAAASSVVTTLAGRPGMSGYDDGTGTAARFNGPSNIAISSAGDLYVVDRQNYTIRKVTPAGVVTTVMGVVGHQDKVTLGALPGQVDPFGIAIYGNTLYIYERNGVAKVTPLP